MRLSVDADITRAETLPGEAYRSRELHARIVDRVFAPSWQLAPDASLVATGTIFPFTLLPGTLDDPLLLARDGQSLRCLSNVCTHRGALLCDEPCEVSSLRCFVCANGQGVNYARGTWHHPLLAIGAESDFLVVDRAGAPGEVDCEEHWLEDANVWIAMPGDT